MSTMSEADIKIREIGKRIRELRELEGISAEELAQSVGMSAKEYKACEAGESDMHFTFIYRCANALNVNVTELIEGYSPRLRSYTLTRARGGQRISQAYGMTYYNMAYSFKNRIAEPLYVRCTYDPEAQNRPIDVTVHAGQECDIVVEGSLKVQVGEHSEILGPGDSIYYDSGTPHGMIAVGGRDCIFYAIVLNPAGAPIPELAPAQQALTQPAVQPESDTKTKTRLYRKYIDVEFNENGTPTSISFKNTEHFNFAFDIVDELAERDPDHLAMLHISKDKTERRFTWSDIRKNSNRCANYFKALGIRKGDRVMLILKRHYQFWFATLGLEKIGAISIPATHQLQAHDLAYRFRTAGVTAIICTPDDDTARQVELADEKYGGLANKIIVNSRREGWRFFDEEYQMYSTHFHRPEDAPCGDDLMLMYFTSGTSGYPKIAAHNFKYPLGQFHTAKYWQNVDPEGLHLTISDTGWAKAAWGKLYGQWMAEAPIFVYDFDRFDAADILPMFAKYHITTFCAPPTMLRMMIKQDISRYDFSSVQHMTTAGEALNPEVYRQFEKATGLRIMEGFGQSESAVIIGNLRGAPHKIGSMGRACPTYRVALLDADGHEVEPGESGEICIDISGGIPCGLAVQYFNDPVATENTWKDGYYHTRDVAWQDEDGFYYYVGRADDVIKSSGYRIGPFEIESVIMELPYVLECGVSAAPDPVRGQVVKASIVLVKGTEPSDELAAEIQTYVKTHTAPYKYPRIVVFRDSLPKTTSGKIIRHEL